jgi:hypothetical protein
MCPSWRPLCSISMAMAWSNFVYYTILLIEGLLLVYALSKKPFHNTTLGIFTLCLGLSFASDLVSRVYISLGLWNTHITNFYVAIDFSLMIVFFYFLLGKNMKWLFVGLLLSWILFSFGMIVFGPGEYGIYTFRDELRVIRNVVGIFFLMAWVFQQLLRPTTESLTSLPVFWIFSGLLVYYGGSLFVFLLSSFLDHYFINTGVSLWIIHNGVSLVKNGLYYIGISKINSSKNSIDLNTFINSLHQNVRK